MLTRKLDHRLLYWIFATLISSLALVSVAQAQGQIVITPTPAPTLSTGQVASTVANAATGAANTVTGTARALWDQLSLPPQSELEVIVLIVGGVLLLLGGWLVYEWIILIAGFLIGAMTALALVNSPDTLVALVVFIIGGLIGMGLGVFLYYVAVFLIGGYVGIAIAEGLAATFNLTPVSAIAVIIAFVIGGVILLGLSLELLVIFSAIVGAEMIAVALGLGFGWMLLLALVGILLQFMVLRTRGLGFRRRPLRRRPWRRAVVVE
ncbi:MAG TPA: hypothetical protein VHD90_19150 [Phototrophicaceae bacterium]|nr:hypothetical protein [Phototrophicaceae bacterium]